jgi:hypothetical protein
MYSTQDFAALAALVLATIPAWYYLTPILNTANWTLVANVLTCTSGSSICAINKSVGPNALLTTEMRFTSGTLDLRIANRFLTNTSPNATYYWAGVTGANFRVGKTVDGVFTTLASVAYALSVNTWATFTLQVVGDSIEATIDDGVTQQTLQATDTDIPEGGTHFVRSGPTNNCAIECREASVREAA